MQQSAKIDQFLEAVDIRVEAFGICEIGRQYSLRCTPFESVVVHFVLSGEGFLECRHGRFPLKPGTAVVVPKRLAKDLSGTGPVDFVKDAEADCTLQDDLVRFGACDGTPDLVLGCAELSSSVAGELPLFDKAKRPIIEHSDDPLLQALFTTMFDELRNPRLGTRAFVSALMKQILIVLLRTRPDDESSKLLMTGPRLAGVVAAILDRPQDNYTVDSLAAIAGMSRSRFSHHFTLAYECSPKTFVQTARLSSAARMLKASDLPVKTVAATFGYASRSHFSRAFQAKFGLDPSAFRKRPPSEPNWGKTSVSSATRGPTKVFITDILLKRPPARSDCQREKKAILSLATHFGEASSEVLPRFVQLAMEMTAGVAAGLSIFDAELEPDIFRWKHLHGSLARFEGATTPRDYSPCGVTLDANAPVLVAHPERRYDWIAAENLILPEVLLVPLSVGGEEQLGTLWVVSDKKEHFDSGDAQAISELAVFVGMALGAEAGRAISTGPGGTGNRRSGDEPPTQEPVRPH